MSALFILLLFAADIKDLGSVTEHRGIFLRSGTNRTDFARFELHLQAQRWPSNHVTLSKTNNILELEELTALPSGPVEMRLRTVHADGTKSRAKKFTFVIEREDPDDPDDPDAHGVLIGPKTVQLPLTPSPTVPGLPPPNLPRGTNETYSGISKIQESWQREFYSRQRRR